MVLLVAGALGAALIASTVGSAAPGDIDATREEAQAVLDQIREMDAELGKAVEAYNGASVRLQQLEAELSTAQRRLELARGTYAETQRRLSERVVALYTGGGDDSTLEVILGAASLDDLLDRVDAASRIADQDTRLVQETKRARGELAGVTRRLEKATAEQRQLVAERAAQRGEIEQRLADREAYYEAVKDEIADLIAEEREREQRLAEQAQRELAAQQRLAAAAQTAVQATPSAPAPAPVAVDLPPGSGVGLRAVQIAMQYLGVPYVWGGASPSGFDCSGLTLYAYAQLGISLPHYAASQFGMGAPVSRDQLAPGDLVFFDGLGHMGMYVGGGSFIHAPHTGDVVKISSLSEPWYASRFVGARRVA